MSPRIYPILAIIVILSSAAVWAKRAAPPEVAPVIQGNMEYRVSASRPGCVEARDTKTDERWWRQIYVLAYDPALEKDVQDVFIKEMKAVDGALHIVNERGDEYKLNLQTLAVEVVKGSLIIRKGH